MGKISKLIVITIICLFVTYEVCSASPSITSVSGELSSGQTIVLSGSGFGSHSDNNSSRDYISLGWENFEAGTADTIFTATYGPELVVGGAAQKRNSSYAAKGYRWTTDHTYTNVWGQEKTTQYMYGFNLGIPTYQKKIFISGWFMFPVGFDTGIRYDTSNTDQTKFICLTPRATLDGGSDGGKTYFQTRKSLTDIPLRTETEDGYLSEGDSDPLFSYAPMGTWHRFDIYVDLTKPDGQKIHNWYVDGKKISRSHQFYNNDAALTSTGIINGFDYLSWLMYQFQGADDPIWPQYMDDAFADLTQARVELSESSTWDESVQTNKNIQLPMSWSDSEISIKVNMGNFASDKDLYIYVIDDNGEVSPSFKVFTGAKGKLVPGNSSVSSGGSLKIQ